MDRHTTSLAITDDNHYNRLHICSPLLVLEHTLQGLQHTTTYRTTTSALPMNSSLAIYLGPCTRSVHAIS